MPDRAMVHTIPAETVRAALAMMKPRPSVEMYPGDWLRDPISGCSLAANGFWWRAMMVMHDAKPYGHLVNANGQPLTDQQIVQRCGCRSGAEFRKVVAEIESVGVPGRTLDPDYVKAFAHEPLDVKGGSWLMDLSPLAIGQAGVIYSRRMIRDRVLSLVRFFVSPKGQLLIPLLSAQSSDVCSRAGVRSAEDEDEVGSLSQPSKSTEGVQGEPTERVLTPQQRAVGILLEAFPFDVRPHPGLAARWIAQMSEGLGNPDPVAAAEAVREIVWKYPTKGADYIAKCVATAALKARTEPKESHVNRTTHPSGSDGRATAGADSAGSSAGGNRLGRYKPHPAPGD